MRGSFLCSSDMLIAIYFEIEFLLENGLSGGGGGVVRRSHSSAPPPKSQFRGQGIHRAISLGDLRNSSLENTSGQSFE